jgi:hypothetical protein
MDTINHTAATLLTEAVANYRAGTKAHVLSALQAASSLLANEGLRLSGQNVAKADELVKAYRRDFGAVGADGKKKDSHAYDIVATALAVARRASKDWGPERLKAMAPNDIVASLTAEYEGCASHAALRAAVVAPKKAPKKRTWLDRAVSALTSDEEGQPGIMGVSDAELDKLAGIVTAERKRREAVEEARKAAEAQAKRDAKKAARRAAQAAAEADTDEAVNDLPPIMEPAQGQPQAQVAA